MTTRVFNLRIEADHPSLPGHFPGHPLVPGVLLLDRTIAAAEQWLERPLTITHLQHAKFVRPLLPEQDAFISLTLIGSELRFEISKDDDRIAQGAFKLGVG
jgi:3-hydroxyacyl-[acyl-carrier-protein] dehydratase